MVVEKFNDKFLETYSNVFVGTSNKLFVKINRKTK